MTVIDDDRDAAYAKIYEQERHVIRSLPSYEFDFTVIARRGRPIEDLVGFKVPRRCLSGAETSTKPRSSGRTHRAERLYLRHLIGSVLLRWNHISPDELRHGTKPL